MNHSCKCHCWKTYSAYALVHTKDAELWHFHWYLLYSAFRHSRPNGLVPKIENTILNLFLTMDILLDEIQGSLMTLKLKSVGFLIPNELSLTRCGWTRSIREEMTQFLHNWELWEMDTLQRVVLSVFSTYFTTGTIILWKTLFCLFLV